jgi:NADH-quinone oxidoreductase subunit I
MQKIYKIFGWDLWQGMFVTLKYFFKKKVTIQYPEQKKAKSERFRGIPCLLSHPDGSEKCIACKLCERICPSKAITVEPAINDVGKTYAKKYELDVGKCLVCGLCEQSCPVDAIKMSAKLYYPIAGSKKLIFDKKRLLNMIPLVPLIKGELRG